MKRKAFKIAAVSITLTTLLIISGARAIAGDPDTYKWMIGTFITAITLIPDKKAKSQDK